MAVTGPAPYKFGVFTAHIDAVSNSAASAYLIGSATGGPTLPGAQGGKIAKLSVDCNVTDDTSGTSLTVTVYKDAFNAANEVMQVVITLDGTGDEQGTSTTVIDAGKDIFAADSELIVAVTSAGTTYAVADVNVAVEYAVNY